uniref:iron-sulfur cluster co-chaperone protein HscB isoform X2 n=1 Tax=Monopterus albus TaxID=43700 RepID=UPI0009B43795|nr:iron-sulfur cluster co-chaperone protein HscB, mitochondrial isoform X2 [Monopterus albus]
MSEMSLRALRIVRSSRDVLHLNWLMTSPLSVSDSVPCLVHWMSTRFPNRDVWHSSINFRALRKGRELFYDTKQVSSPRNYCTGQVRLNCWNCKRPLDKTPTFFCMFCNVVQPPDEGASYFTIMDCDYTFTLDTQRLQKRYLQLQRSLHPDNFGQKSVKEREYSESQSAHVNKAYKTLLKPLSRGVYMLKLEGIHVEEGSDSGVDSELLMMLMEINEALDEAQTPEEASKIGQDTKGAASRKDDISPDYCGEHMGDHTAGRH